MFLLTLAGLLRLARERLANLAHSHDIVKVGGALESFEGVPELALAGAELAEGLGQAARLDAAFCRNLQTFSSAEGRLVVRLDRDCDGCVSRTADHRVQFLAARRDLFDLLSLHPELVAGLKHGSLEMFSDGRRRSEG